MEKIYMVEKKEYENNIRVILIERMIVDIGCKIVDTCFVKREYLVCKDTKKVFLLQAYLREEIGMNGKYLGIKR